jgi:hypothetical protein
MINRGESVIPSSALKSLTDSYRNNILNAMINKMNEFGNHEPKSLVRGFKSGAYMPEPTIKSIDPQCPTCGGWSITNRKCDYCGNKY